MIDRSASAASSGADVTLVLPDGTTRTVPAGALPAEVVRSIGERLLMAAVAVSVVGEIQDLMTPLRRGGVHGDQVLSGVSVDPVRNCNSTDVPEG